MSACPNCPVSAEVRVAVLDVASVEHVALLSLPLLVVGALAAVWRNRPSGPLVSAGVVLGAGLGGFVDGIVLHQILQWHNMLSAKIPPVDLASMKVNMVYDGLFHAGTWLMTVAGLALLWRALRRERGARSGRVLVGGLILGWGTFNVVEGLIDHLLLGLHHVHPGAGQLAWDIGFVAFGAIQVAAGALLVRDRIGAGSGGGLHAFDQEPVMRQRRHAR